MKLWQCSKHSTKLPSCWLQSISLSLTVKLLNPVSKTKSIETKLNEIALSQQTITRRIEDLSHDVSEQLKDRVHTCSFFVLALGESADICDVVQLSIFIRGIDNNFNIFEELIGLELLHGRIRGSKMSRNAAVRFK